jgi:hypothetical protein
LVILFSETYIGRVEGYWQQRILSRAQPSAAPSITAPATPGTAA